MDNTLDDDDNSNSISCSSTAMVQLGVANATAASGGVAVCASAQITNNNSSSSTSSSSSNNNNNSNENNNSDTDNNGSNNSNSILNSTTGSSSNICGGGGVGASNSSSSSSSSSCCGGGGDSGSANSADGCTPRVASNSNVSTGNAIVGGVGCGTSIGPTGQGGTGGNLNPLNRADAVRRQSIEVVQLAKSDVEELHAKLKSLQEVLTKGEREKMQLEAQIGALKAQAALKPPQGDPTMASSDPDQLLDALLALLQQEKNVESKCKEKVNNDEDQEENNIPEPSDGSLDVGTDSLDAKPCRQGLVLRSQPGFANKLAILVALCSPASHTTTTTSTTATSATASTACGKKYDPTDPSTRNGLLTADEGNPTVVVANSATTVANVSLTTNNNNGEDHLVVNTTSSSVEQCSAITDRFQEKINKQQETIERLNNALEEVELILEESHAKNASLQDKLARQEQKLAFFQDTEEGKKDLTAEVIGAQQQTDDIEMSGNEIDELKMVDGSTLLDSDPTKEPSSSTDVTTSSSSGGALTSTEANVARLRAELDSARREVAATARREAELTDRCADFTHQIENLTSQLTELTSQAGSGGIPGAAGAGAKLEELQRENQNLMLELSEVQHSLNRLSSENDRLKTAVASSSSEEERVAEEQQRQAEHQTAISVVEAAKAKAESAADALRRDLEQVKKEAAHAALKIEEEARKVDDDKKRFEEQVVTKQTELDLERNRLAETKSQLDSDAVKLKSEQEVLQQDQEKLNEGRLALQQERLLFDEEKTKSHDVIAAAKANESELRERCSELAQRLDEACAELAEVKNQLEKRNSELEEALRKSRDLEETRNETEKCSRELSAKIEKMETEIASLKNQQIMEPPSLEVEMLLQELRTDLATSRSTLDERIRELALSKERITELETKATGADAALKAEKEQVSERKAEVEALRDQLSEQTKQLNEVKGKLESLTGQIRELEEQVETGNDKVLEANERAEALKAQLELVGGKLKESQKNGDNQTAKLTELEGKIEQATSELTRRSDEIQSLQAQVEKEKARGDEIDKELGDVRQELEKHSASQQANSSLQEELADVTERLSTSEARASAAEAAQEDTRAKLHHATEENSRIMHELKAMDEEKTSLHVDLVKCRQQLCETTQIKSSLEKLRAENSELRSGAETSRVEAERVRAEIAEQRAISERLSIELGKGRQEAATAAAGAARDKEALMSEIAALSEKHLKVNSELESARTERTSKAELAAQLGAQLAALLTKTKEAAIERDNQERQMTAIRNELAGKVAQTDKLTKDLRSAVAHTDNLKKQVSKLLLAVAEKEKHLAALHSDNQKLRGEIQAYGDKLAGQDALINRIAQLEQDIASRNVTISKVCAEREDGVRQLEQLRARHGALLREVQETRDAREVECQAAARHAIERAAEQANLTDRLAKAGEELDQLKKRHDIALSERTIAESRCRSTLNLSRKLEKEVVTLQKDKERIANELIEVQQHVTYLEKERTDLLKSFKDLPEKMQKLQTENNVLRNEVEKLRDREHAWAPLVQAGLARGRKQANANAATQAAAAAAATTTTTTTAAVTTVKATDTAVAPAVSSAPQSKKKTIFARLKDGTSDKTPSSDQSPVRSKIAIFEEKGTPVSGSSAALPAPATPASASSAASGSSSGAPSPTWGPGQRRRGVRRSASDVDFGNAAPPPSKRGSNDANRKDTAASSVTSEESSVNASTAGAGVSRRETNAKGSIGTSAQQAVQQVPSTTPKGRSKISSSTEEDEEDEIALPAPMASRRRSQQGAVGGGKAPTPPKSRGPQTPSSVKNKSNASTSGQKGRGASDRSTLKDTTAGSTTAAGNRSSVAAKAPPEREYATQQPKGRRSLVKGTPKKTPTGSGGTIGRLGTPVNDIGGTGSEGGVGGRSLRASTLVVKKASDIDAKQREQFKHKGRPSAGALSTDV